MAADVQIRTPTRLWNPAGRAAVREAATGIFLGPAWGLYDSINGDKFKHIHFSHD